MTTTNTTNPKKKLVIIGAVIAALVIVGLIVWAMAAQASQRQAAEELETAQSEQSAAVLAYQTECDVLVAQVASAETLFNESKDKVVDEGTRTALQSAINNATLLLVEREYGLAETVEVAEDLAQSADTNRASIEKVGPVLQDASVAVMRSMVEKPLKVYQTNLAKAENNVMVDSYDRVADNAVRDGLQAQIDAGNDLITQVANVSDDKIVNEYTNFVSQINSGNRSLVDAMKTVTDAVSAKTQADEEAAQQAAASTTGGGGVTGYSDTNNSYSGGDSGDYSGYSPSTPGGTTSVGSSSSGSGSSSGGANSNNGSDNGPFGGDDCFAGVPGEDPVMVPCD